MRLAPITPESSLDLGDAAAAPPDGAPDKQQATAETERLVRSIDELQEALYAEERRALLVVLQGRDTAGKDGAIRKVFGPLDLQGITVTNFKAPSAEELAHDYLWRIHRAVPTRGTIGIFNRSHYEDVLVVRVHAMVPEAVWRPRYEQIVRFERLELPGGLVLIDGLEHHVAFELLADVCLQLESRHLQEADSLLQLRGHRQCLTQLQLQ